jgi:hypothetical protein
LNPADRRRIVGHMVVAGLAGIAAGMGIAAWASMRWTMRGRFELGLAVVAVAALAFFAAALLLAGPAALSVPAGATIIGFALALALGGGDGDGDADDEPPWWPSFERELRRYERNGPRTRTRA